MRSGLLIFVVLFPSLSAIALDGGQTRAAFLTTDELVAGLTRAFQTIQQNNFSVDYYVRTENDEQGYGVVRFPVEHVRIAMHDASGKLYGWREAKEKAAEGPEVSIVEESTFDGKSVRSRTNLKGTIYRKNTGAFWLDKYLEKLGYALRPEEREFAQHRKDILLWVPNCFEKQTYRVAPELEKVGNDWCHILEVEGVDRMWIDASHGFAIRKRRFKGTNLLDHTSLAFEVLADPIQEVLDGVWLPTRLITESFSENRRESLSENHGESISENHHGVPAIRGGQTQRILREVIDVDKLTLGQPFPPDQFTLMFPPGSEVYDSIADRTYRIPMEGMDVVEQSIQAAANNRRPGFRFQDLLRRQCPMAFFVGTLVSVLAWIVVKAK